MAPDAHRPGSSRAAIALVALCLTSALGVAVAGYLTWVHFDDAALVCVAGGGCETVQESEYAEIAGAPVALLGLGAYTLAGGGVVWDPQPGAPWREGTVVGDLLRRL